MIINIVKRIVKKIFFKKGKIYTIILGPMKGLKILLSDNSQYAPLVGNWEPTSQYIFKKLIKSGDVVFDLGANIGIHTLLFAKLTGKSGCVVGFEPLKENLKELEFNVKVNDLGNVKLENMAISESEGTAVFNLGMHNTQGSLNSLGNESGTQVEVMTTTLDKYISNNGLKPNFIKIDVEGAENSVLIGFQKEIELTKPIVFVESHSIENELFLLKYFKKNGYVFYEQVNSGYHNDLGIKFLNKLNPIDRLFDNNNGTGTIVAIHDSKRSNLLL